MARSMAPVHVTGESGSGKELAARLIHQLSGRAEGPFIAVNCGAIPENLMESEFFGYRKGAFTGADSDRIGFFMAANGGTLFLDEVADLPLAMQVKLLRAIQEKRIRKVGAVTEEAVDVRIVSATHQPLMQGIIQLAFLLVGHDGAQPQVLDDGQVQEQVAGVGAADLGAVGGLPGVEST